MGCSDSKSVDVVEAQKNDLAAISMQTPVGIDLGTTFSCIAIWRNSQVEIVPDENGFGITPSVVSFSGQERLVGLGALNQAIKNPKNTVFDAKRLIGRQINDKEVQEDLGLFPFVGNC